MTQPDIGQVRTATACVKHVADPSLSFHVLSFLSDRYTGAKQTFINHLRKGSEAVQFLS